MGIDETVVEIVDVFNDVYEHIGVAEKRAAHRDGLWHQTFSALVLNPVERTVFLQRKFPGGYGFERADYADITVGGHLLAGERAEDGVREVKEELGLDLNYEDLVPLGIRQTAATLSPNYVEREFQHWHLIPVDLSVEDFGFSGAEVQGLISMPVDAALDLAAGHRTATPATLAFVDETGAVHRMESALSIDDLVPNYTRLDRLYLRLFLAARRFMDGEREYLFW